MAFCAWRLTDSFPWRKLQFLSLGEGPYLCWYCPLSVFFLVGDGWWGSLYSSLRPYLMDFFPLWLNRSINKFAEPLHCIRYFVRGGGRD